MVFRIMVKTGLSDRFVDSADYSDMCVQRRGTSGFGVIKADLAA